MRDVSEDLTGRFLGNYEIESELGRTGMSVSYRATDVRLGQPVALKLIDQHVSGDPEFRERFADEARNASAVEHPNVVSPYEFGEIGGVLYIATRLVEGVDLAGLLVSGPLDPLRALDLLEQVASALDHLHGWGLVHLDLEPANILIIPGEAGGERAYLADFGLVRRGATAHGAAADSPASLACAAPEDLRCEPVEARADVYGLACVLFACLTGRPPFEGSLSAVIQQHLGSPVPAVTSAVFLPVALDGVVWRGMDKLPANRHGSCGEFVAAARAALAPPATVPDAAAGPAASGQPHGFPTSRVPSEPVGSAGRPVWDGVPAQGPVPWGYAADVAGWSGEPAPAPAGASPVTRGFPANRGAKGASSDPARSMPFGRRRGGFRGSGSGRWLLPLVLSLALLAGAVLSLVIFLPRGGSEQQPYPEPTNGHQNERLPTVVPTVNPR